jgi:hypothetical protein
MSMIFIDLNILSGIIEAKLFRAEQMEIMISGVNVG